MASKIIYVCTLLLLIAWCTGLAGYHTHINLILLFIILLAGIVSKGLSARQRNNVSNT